ncbi:hypothetical protein FXW78_25190 [Rhodococcus opacus]|nr:hypothetical protein [Rhodococcus opacus]
MTSSTATDWSMPLMIDSASARGRDDAFSVVPPGRRRWSGDGSRRTPTRERTRPRRPRPRRRPL